MNKYIVEATGTFFLVLTISLSANPIAIGFMLAAMIYMGGYISGAHYNPAVTLTVYLQNKISNKDAINYVIFQMLGAIFACLIFNLFRQTPFVVQPGNSISFFQALIFEAIFTFALCSVILHTAVSKKNTPNQFYGLAIGATVMAAAFSVGAITGGAFNPAVGIAPAIVNMFFGNGFGIINVLLYISGPSLGAVCASMFHSFLFKTDN